ncbi:MAG: hypothetical protein NVS3B28_25290 [Candidatus Velthaea sp.]
MTALVSMSPLCARPAGDAAPSAFAILSRVKIAYRARPKPAYVVYTLERRDKVEGRPDFLNSYTLRIWCRTSDRAALSRRVSGGRVTGDLEFIRPEFDKPVDPGPPTADVFESLAPRSIPAPVPSGAPDVSPFPRIGSVAVLIEREYNAEYAVVDGTDEHLKLTPRRDPRNNRLTDVYVDRATSMLARAVSRDHLYSEGRSIPERFEVDFGMSGDVPVITAIHGRTDYAQMTVDQRGDAAFHEVDYRFTGITFPSELPAWYFEPREYGAHRGEAPN